MGLSCEEVVREVTRIQIRRGMMPLTIFSLGSEVSIFNDYYEPIISRLKKIVSLRIWDRLRYSKFKDDRVRVAFLDLGYFLTREVERALKRIGAEFIRVPIKKDESGEAVISKIIESILRHKPDFFLTINHLGFDEEGALTSFLKVIDMPVASWYVDSPNLIVKAFDKNISPFTCIFLWDREYIEDMRDMGFESVDYLPLAADEEVFKPMRLKDRELRLFDCDVGFVGNSMLKTVEENLELIDREYHGIVDVSAERIAVDRSLSREPLLLLLDKGDATVLHSDRKGMMELEKAILRKATLLYRLSCVKTLSGFNAKVFGDSGWRELLGRSIETHPPIDYYRELPKFYNACRITLNATNLQMPEAVNQRVFDCPASGGFILTDHQGSLPELFEPGREVVAYRDKDEIPELVRYYLDNFEERVRIAMKGRERVLKEHTYRHRMERLVASMRKRFKGS